MPRISDAERRWKSRINDPTLTDEQRNEAAEKYEQIKRRHAREKIAKLRARNKKVLADDPEPKHDPLCGMSRCVDGCKHIAWYNRQPERPTEPIAEPPARVVKIEQPVVAAKIPPMPKITPRPAPVDTFWADFKAKPIFERNMILKTLNPARQVEWEMMQEEQRMKAAAFMATQPPAPSLKMTEEQKRNISSSPMVRHDVFDAGKPQTVDEVRETYGPTMGNATPDSGLSPELDRRGWLPNVRND